MVPSILPHLEDMQRTYSDMSFASPTLTQAGHSSSHLPGHGCWQGQFKTAPAGASTSYKLHSCGTFSRRQKHLQGSGLEQPVETIARTPPTLPPVPSQLPAACFSLLPDSQVSEDLLGSSFSSAGDFQDTSPYYLPCGFWGCTVKMSWRQVILLASLSALVLLCREYGRGQGVGRVNYTVRLGLGKFVQVP